MPVDAQEQLGEVEGTSQLKRIAIIARDRKCYRRKIIKTQNGFSGRPCEKNRRGLLSTFIIGKQKRIKLL